MTAVYGDIYLFLRSLDGATNSYVGSVLKKVRQKFVTVNKGLKIKKTASFGNPLAIQQKTYSKYTQA
jgi:hypothetical protein